ncbi:30S ribosomal protein S3ae [Methanogenium organophilum]|uniref:30S ribosomal protein S3ae n=1 Tax=Methanogenium organophilum TaxID=2199 RepID=UPI002DD42A93|nr:30S ribosomal protein S3ae [Methanogenium organophilum]
MARRKKQVGRRVEGWKAKSWYKVYAPEYFDRAYLGETIAGDAQKVVGRVMRTTLGEMTSDYSKQNVKMNFKVTNVGGDSAYTEFVGHEVTKDYLRAMVKRRTSRIDSLVMLTTKEGRKIRVTASCFTISRADMSQAKAIRSTITQYLIAKSSSMTYEQFVRDMVLGELSREIFKIVKKIYPTRRVEIIKSKGEEKATGKARVVVEEPVAEAEPVAETEQVTEEETTADSEVPAEDVQEEEN